MQRALTLWRVSHRFAKFGQRLLAAGLSVGLCLPIASCSLPPSSALDTDGPLDAAGALDAPKIGEDAGVDVAPLAPLARGVAAMNRLDQLYRDRFATLAGQASSYDRSGGNADGFGASNFLYVDAAGEKVMLDLRGSGTVYSMWFTGFDPQTAWLKVYIDGESSPRLNVLLADLFAGKHPDFRWPLVLDDRASSGGFVVQVPLPFRERIRVTTNGAGAHFFYHLGYRTYPASQAVASWAPGAHRTDLLAARRLWDGLGVAPTAAAAGAPTHSGTVDLPAGAERDIVRLPGAGLIAALKLRLPGVAPRPARDRGRAHRGSSRFTVRIDPANTGVVLRRRFDPATGAQRAEVLVDGISVGQWIYEGAGPSFAGSELAIPAALTAGKAELTITVNFVSAIFDWNEFHYWVYSKVGDVTRLTDVLDVGHPGAEALHGYTISGQTWQGERASDDTPSSAEAGELLRQIRLRAYWDGDPEPGIDAPLGAFFGLGVFDTPAATSALLVGVDPRGELYAYFPMPYASGARLTLTSARSQATRGIGYQLVVDPTPRDYTQSSRFKTRYAHARHSGGDGQDVELLAVKGSGQLVGVVQSMIGVEPPLNLEGDERIYLDGRRSPAFHGTGKEDFYRGGWYFLHGPFSRAAHGCSLRQTIASPLLSRVVAYRFFLPAPVPFRRELRFSIEHGTENDQPEDSWNLVWYYHRPEPSCRLSDELDVGDPASESAHGYAVVQQSWQGQRSGSFEGSADTKTIVDRGRAHRGRSSFRLAVEPGSDGALLRRRFDQFARPEAGPPPARPPGSLSSQEAEVWVDGARVGSWYTPGGNATHRWREEDFWIPRAFVAGKTSVKVELRATSTNAWSEHRYWLFSCAR
jgi:hypothetical protein